MEEWKDIKGYEGMYQISNEGRVRSFRKSSSGILMKTRLVKGYVKVTFKVDGVPHDYYIHRLVMENFCPIENMNEMEVNHKDENKENNNITNLEWCTHYENLMYGTRGQRSGEKMKNSSRCKPVRCIETNEIYKSIREAERITGFPSTNICQCCKHPNRTLNGQHWEYV